MSTYSPNRNIEQPAYNQYSGNPTGWSGSMNANLTLIDNCFGATLSLSVTGLSGVQALTNVQLQCATIGISGTLTANVTYQIPANCGGLWCVYNLTSGAYSVSFTNATSGSGTVVLPQGYATLINCTGASVSFANTAVATAGGSSTQVQYNSSGTLAGSGSLTWANSSSILALQGTLQLSGSSSGSVGLKAPASGGSGVVWTLPANDGTNGQLLSTNGAGVLSWGGAASGVTSFSAGSTGLTPSSGSTGNVTLGGTLAVANGGTGVTSSTGTGSVVLNSSPTFTGTADFATMVATGYIYGAYNAGIALYDSSGLYDNTNGGAVFIGAGNNLYIDARNSGADIIFRGTSATTLATIDQSGDFAAVGSVAGSFVAATSPSNAIINYIARSTSTYWGIYGSGGLTTWLYGASAVATLSSAGKFSSASAYFTASATVNTSSSWASATFETQSSLWAVSGYSTATSGYGAYIARVDHVGCNLMSFYYGASTNVGYFSTDGTNLNLNMASGTVTCANVSGASTAAEVVVSGNPNGSGAGGYFQTFGSTSSTYAGASIIGSNSASIAYFAPGGLQVTGAITATGNITAYYSDKRLKKDIAPIHGALSKLHRISGVYFRSNAKAAEFGYADSKRQVGVIAQDVAAVMPEVVVPAPFDVDPETGASKSGENYVTVQYEKLTPLLIQAIKELTARVEQLEGLLATP